MLRTFETTDFSWIGKWADTPFELFRFAADTWAYPVTEMAVEEYLQNNPGRHQFIYEVNGTPAGFCELIVKDTETPRLSRIILSRAFRGQGHGKAMINEMLAKAFEISKLKTIYLFVLEDNEAARKCYERSGFKYEEDDRFVLSFESKFFPIIKMSYTYQ